MLLRIKPFSELCRLSVRALHLYDRLGVFSPAVVDPANGYRYYDTDQLSEINTINSFKRIGYTLQEIRGMRAQQQSRDAVIRSLLEKHGEQLRTKEQAANRAENIRRMITSLDQSAKTADLLQEAALTSKVICRENDEMEPEYDQIIWL